MNLLDTYLPALNPLWGPRLCGVVERVTPLTPTSAAISIRPGRGWAGHRAGQFVTLGVDVDGVRHQRCYSITSSETDPSGRIEIAVAAVPGGLVSNHLVHRSRPGDLVRLDGPSGGFTMAGSSRDPLLFVTGGSGITPVMAMLRTLGDGHRSTFPAGPSDVVLIHHAPDPVSTMFSDELERLAERHRWLRVEVVHTGDLNDDAGSRHLSASRLVDLCPDWAVRQAFVCGPESLLDFAVEHWASTGVGERLHLERFRPASALLTDESGGPATIRFATSGIDAAAGSGPTLLDVAEAAGVPAPSGCRMGICHTCTTRLDTGCARDLRDGRVIDAGSHVQLCVSVAVGDVTLDR